MFDWLLNTPLNTITNFFPDVSKTKLLNFCIFLQLLTFPTNTRQRLWRIQKTVEHLQWSFLANFFFFFFCKNHKKTPVPESLFNEVIGLYPATILKERTPAQVFSDEFCEIVKTTSFQNTSRRLLLFYRKIFYQ